MAGKNQNSCIQSQLSSIEKKLEKLDALQKFMNDIESTINLINAQYEDQKRATEKLVTDCANLNNRNAFLEAEVKRLSESLISMEDKQDEIEQHSRRNNLEITGIPITQGENTEAIVQKLAEIANVELPANAIEACHRVPTKVKNKVQPIVVKFATRKVRDALKQGLHKKQLKIKDMIPSRSNDGLIFVNEHLTLRRKKILGKVIEIKRAKNAKYVWTQNGTIFFKKTDNSTAIKINTFGDLKKLSN